jgi:hypothetical protein
MKKIYLLKQCFAISIGLLFFNCYAHAQTNTFPSTGSAGIGTTSPVTSSILEMVSTSQGMLVPRMTKVQRDAIYKPEIGLLLYQTNSTPGFYYYTGTAWAAVTPKAKGWSLTGNSGTTPATNFIGTTDVQPLIFKVNNQKAGSLDYLNANTGFGYQTLNANTSGSLNTANGYSALSLNTTGYYNAATGGYALQNNIGGIANTGNGISALRNNTNGSDNTAAGANALFYNTTGYSNVAIGTNSLFNNTTNTNLVAIGDSALFNNNGSAAFFQAIRNTAIGSKALYSNTIGSYNTANGYQSLYSNNEGWENTANGYQSLYSNTTGYGNTANGTGALSSNTTGYLNTANGWNALSNNSSGSYNTALGYNSASSVVNLVNATAIGSSAVVDASNKVRVGDNNVTSIGGKVGWTTFPSDRRYKKNIKEDVQGLSFINRLKPITYTVDIDGLNTYSDRNRKHDDAYEKLKKDRQPFADEASKIIYNGFIAQDVEATAKKLNYNFSGVDKPKTEDGLYGLRYSDFVVPLVKAVQELSKMNDDKDALIQQQNKKIDDLENRLANLEGLMNLPQSTPNAKRQTLNINNASLEQNIPNPFNQSTVIKYYIPSRFNSAEILITDVNGRSLKRFEIKNAGYGQQTIAANELASGIYQYSLIIDGRAIDSKKMELLR